MRQKLKLLAAFAICASLGFAAAHIGRRGPVLPPERPAEILLGPEALDYTGLDIPVQSELFYALLAFNRDGSLLAAQTNKGIEILDPRTGGETLTVNHEDKRAVSFGFLHTRDTLFSCYAEGTVMLWDLSTGKKTAAYPTGSGTPRGLAVSPDDRTALIIEETGMLSLLDLKNGSTRTLPSPTPTSMASAAAYSPDGTRLAAAWSDGRIVLYNMGDNSILSSRTWTLPEIEKVEFTPDGQKLALSTRAGKAYLLNEEEAAATLLPTEGKAHLLNGSIALLELDARRFAVFDILKGTVTAAIATDGSPVIASAAGPDGASIALEEEGRILTFNISPAVNGFIFPPYRGKTDEEERNYYLGRERARAAFEKTRENTTGATPDFLCPVAAINYNPAKEAFEFDAAGLRLEARADFRRALEFDWNSRELTLSGKLRWKGNNLYELVKPALLQGNGGEALTVTPDTGKPPAIFPPMALPVGKQQRAYETAVALYNAGHAGKATALLETLAREKYAPAMTGLAYLYTKGMVPGKGDKQALQLEREAESAGYAPAQLRMGQRTLYGIGVSSDTGQAGDYFTKAASAGNPEAAYWLGSTLTIEADGAEKTEQDRNQLKAQYLLKAAKWFRKSAEGGFARGQYAYAFILESGKGVEQDGEDALKWYGKAAAQGLPDALAALARIYETGIFAPKDTARALKLLTDAAKADKTFRPQLTAFLARTKSEDLRNAMKLPSKQILPAPEKLSERLTTVPPEKLFGIRMDGTGSVRMSARSAALALLAVTTMILAAVLFAFKKLPSCPRDWECNVAVAGALRLRKSWAALMAATANTREQTPPATSESRDGSGAAKEETGKDKPENKDDTVLKISL